ncbi:ribokinase, partial [uncultured Bacteroides sp.]
MRTVSIHKPKVVVIGSSNTDMVVKANRLPVPGETVLGGTFYMNPGGKGANQAIAASRLGAEVTFISKIGYDLFGLQALEIYKSEKINTEFIFTDQKSPSGVALISVDSFGENSIIVAPGAGRSLSEEDIHKAEGKIKEADIILMQLEVPIETAEYAAAIANKYGKKVILNPAPASTLSDTFLKNVHTILPNRIEAEMLSGIKVMDVESAHRAAKTIGDKGIENVVITLGKDGAYVKERDNYVMIPAKQVETVDTT